MGRLVDAQSNEKVAPVAFGDVNFRELYVILGGDGVIADVV